MTTQLVSTGPRITGKDFNYFIRATVQKTDITYPTEPQAFRAFRGGTCRMKLICTSGSICYSFNGNTDHGYMEHGASNQLLEFETRGEDKIWFRWSNDVSTTVAGPGVVEVHMWLP